MMEEKNTNSGYRVIKGKSKSNKVYKTIMLIVLVAFITFLITSIGMYSYYSNKTSNTNISQLFSKETNTSNISSTLEMYKQIIDKYYLGEIDEEKLAEGAIKGYIEGLDDPYTEYISKEDMESYKEDLLGEFTGIGIYMVKDTKTNKVMVLTPIKYSPAEKAGILPGDLIKSVDNVEYTADQMTELAEKIKGKEGTQVKLEIIRENETKTFELKRENIKVNPVEGEVLEQNIGYITFSSFDENTAEDFKNKYQELTKKGIKSLIIDLRNNGGGIVDQATAIAGTILDKGSTVLYEVDKNKNEKEIKTDTNPIINMPVVVIVNENTASSSEILAGALKDHEKAKIVGTKTYGKGVIQQLISLPNGSGIKVTCEEYQTPNRTSINNIGITPDEEIELPDEVENILKVTRDQDTQLKKAIEILK